MDLFVIKEYDLREKYRFLVSGLTLSSLMDLKKGNRTHLLKLLGSETKCHRNKRIITSGRTDGIQLVLNSLPALVIILRTLSRAYSIALSSRPLQLSSEYFINSEIYLS